MLKKHCDKPKKSTALALIAGALYPFAFAPYEGWFLGIISIALLWVSIQGKTPKQSAWLGFCFGLSSFGIGVSWLHVSMHQYGGTPLWLAIIMTAVFVVFIALFSALQTGLSRWLSQGAKWLSPWVFACVWLLVDVLRGNFLTGFPWLYAGYSLIDTPLAQLATLGGIWLLTFITVFLAALLGALIRWQQRNWRLWLLQVGGAVLLVVTAHQSPPERYVTPAGDPVQVALLQGNIPQDLRWITQMRHATRDIYADLSDQVPPNHLEIWPESALTEFYHQAEGFLDERAAIAEAKNGALVVGIPTYDSDDFWQPGRIHNTIKVLSGGEGDYHKQKLVPFGEFVPFEDQLRGLIPFFDLDMSSFDHGGPNQSNLIAKQVAIAPSICYEIMYPELVAQQAINSNVLITVSNDAWFGTSAGPHQHFQMARLRAIETGRWLLRGTNTGITAIINEKGKVVDSLPQFERGLLLGSFTPLSGQTPFVKWGSWPIWLLAFLGCLPSLWRRTHRYLSQYQPKANHS